jgi:hypothetical protein
VYGAGLQVERLSGEHLCRLEPMIVYQRFWSPACFALRSQPRAAGVRKRARGDTQAHTETQVTRPLVAAYGRLMVHQAVNN